MHRDGIRREKVHDEGIGQIKPVNSRISEREGSNLRPIYDQNGIKRTRSKIKMRQKAEVSLLPHFTFICKFVFQVHFLPVLCIVSLNCLAFVVLNMDIINENPDLTGTYKI